MVVLAIAPFVVWALKRDRDYVIRVTYQDGKGALRQALLIAARHGFETQVVSTHDVDGDSWQGAAVEHRAQLGPAYTGQGRFIGETR